MKKLPLESDIKIPAFPFSYKREAICTMLIIPKIIPILCIRGLYAIFFVKVSAKAITPYKKGTNFSFLNTVTIFIQFILKKAPLEKKNTEMYIVLKIPPPLKF